MRVALLTNPQARQGRGEAAAARIAAAITARGHTVRRIRPTSVDSIGPSIAAAVADGSQRLLLAGGDGLIHHALPAILETGVDVGILAVGTGNDFSRAVGIDSKGFSRGRWLERAVNIALGPTSAFDVMHTPAGPVASVATAGFSGSVNQTANAMRLPLGAQKYTLATLRESARLQPMALRLLLDGDRSIEQEACLVAIANTRYFGGGMAICPEADPTDGCLDVTIVDPLSAPKLLAFLPLVFSGRHVRHPAVNTYRAKRIEAAADASFWGDGERLDFSAGVFHVGEGALRLAAPHSGTSIPST